MSAAAVAAVFDYSPLREQRRERAVAPRRGASDDVPSRWPRDRVSISKDAGADDAGAPAGEAGAAEPGRPEGLDPVEEAELRSLKQRDGRVRAHEAAHEAAGGPRAGSASFTYEIGPDGKQYAVGGEVPIRLGGGRTPEETIEIARQVRAAALAPADPSAQDLAVAASAAQMEADARAQLARRAAAAYATNGARPARATP